MRRRRTLWIVIAAAPVLLVVLALLYLNFADLSRWRGTVAGLVSDALGREVAINGAFEPDIGLTTTLKAGGITLANMGWGSEPTMASIDHLELKIRLPSLVIGPFDLERLEIDGLRVLLESDGAGRSNWEFESGDDAVDDGGAIELGLGTVGIRNAEVVYRDRSLDQPFEFRASELTIRGDDTDMLDVQVDGQLDRKDFQLAGRLGPLAGLLQARSIGHDLTGHLGGIDFSSRGNIADLGTLGGADLALRIAGAELAVVGELLDLEGIDGGPFEVELAVRPAAIGSNLELEAAAGEMSAKISGSVDSLLDPRMVDVEIRASGPDVRSVGAVTGVEGLPAEAFAVSGHVRWEGFPMTCDSVEARVGDNTLAAHGVLGEPPLMMGTDFSFEGEGPDISSLAALVGVRLPKDGYTVSGRLVRIEGGLGVEGVELRIGRSALDVDGRIGDPPEYAGTALTLSGRGPNLARFQGLADVALPAEPFDVTGRLVQGDGGIGLEGFLAHLGRNVFEVSGQLVTEAGLAGTDLRLSFGGPDASQIAAIADVPGVPAEPWHAEGRIRVLDWGYRVDNLAASLGSLSATTDGVVGPLPELLGSDLQIHVEDIDLSHPAAIAGVSGLPRDAFAVDSRVRIEGQGYRLDGLRATVGDIDLEADGLVGAPPELQGSDMRFAVRGRKLSSLDPYIEQTALPPVPFSVSGNVRISGAGYVLHEVAAEVDDNHVTLDGTVRPATGFVGTDLQISATVPDLERAGGLAAGFRDLPALPAEPFSLETRVLVDERGYRIERLRAALGTAVASVDGRVGEPPEYFGTDLVLNVDGPNASLFTAVTGVTAPVAPFRLAGRAERNLQGFRFHAIDGRLGDYRASIDGTLGEPPRWIGTDLTLRASGPGTGLIAEIAGVPYLPDHPFQISGELKGTPERFTAHDVTVTFGPSDLSGSLTADITAKPDVRVRLISSHLDLSRLRERLEGPSTGTGKDDAVEPPSTARPERLISDVPLDLAVLEKADAAVAVRIETLVLPAKQFSDVALDLTLRDGRLEIERLAAVGQARGRLDGSLVLEPFGDAYRLRSQLTAHQLTLDIPGSEVDREAQPTFDIEVDLAAEGASPHLLASSANGSLQLVIGRGVMDNSVLDLVTADILLTLLSAFNPFAKESAATELQCGVALVSLEDGLATLEPMALQSDRMTMLGKGKIDFRTEKLDLEWVTKPRKGIGISASMLTNPYIKLGGTLSKPSVEMKGMEAVASTGVAVATMGISLVAKGMFDRVTAEKKVCKKALEEIVRRLQPLPAEQN